MFRCYLLILLLMMPLAVFAQDFAKSSDILDPVLSDEDIEFLDNAPEGAPIDVPCELLLPNGEMGCDFIRRMHREHPEEISQKELDECKACQ